jgi:hypothetical protein
VAIAGSADGFSPHAVIFIDSRVADLQSLIDGA